MTKIQNSNLIITTRILLFLYLLNRKERRPTTHDKNANELDKYYRTTGVLAVIFMGEDLRDFRSPMMYHNTPRILKIIM